MKAKKIYQINDRTMKYKSLILNKHQHRYLKLPGKFEARYPQEIVFPNMNAGRADEFYSTEEGLMVNLEEESGEITEKVLEKISNYVVFADFMYSKRPYSAIICHKNPGKLFEYYERSPSIIIKVHYIYIPQETLWRKYENIIKKIKQKEQLSIDETLDMAFIPKFISKENGKFITESLSKAFKHAKIHETIMKRDIGVLLGAMVLKHFDDAKKINELMEEIGMKQIENEIKIIAREEFKEELEEIEKENNELKLENGTLKNENGTLKNENGTLKNENGTLKNENGTLKNENGEYKKGIEKLKEMEDLNTPEAKNIINSLIML